MTENARRTIAVKVVFECAMGIYRMIPESKGGKTKQNKKETEEAQHKPRKTRHMHAHTEKEER